MITIFTGSNHNKTRVKEYNFLQTGSSDCFLEFDKEKVFKFLKENDIEHDCIGDVNYRLTKLLKVIYSTNHNKIHLSFPEACQSEKVTVLLANIIAEQSASKDITIDTNSLIFFNMLRVNVKKGILKPEDVSIVFFGNTDYDKTITLNKKAKVSIWKKGFFDELNNIFSFLF